MDMERTNFINTQQTKSVYLWNSTEEKVLKKCYHQVKQNV